VVSTATGYCTFRPGHRPAQEICDFGDGTKELSFTTNHWVIGAATILRGDT
jgi:hypothetical protein